MTATAKVLVVCTANQCRSPMIELLLGHALTDCGVTPRWDVRSAGTRAVDGSPILTHAAAVLAARGIASDHFRSRSLDVDEIAAADLILTAERAHAGEVISLVPDVLHRTFTLCQFARLLRAGSSQAQEPVTMAGLVERASRARSRSEPSDDELVDPIGGRRRRYEMTASRIDAAVAGIMDAIGPPAIRPAREASSSPVTART